jgi:Glycosyltransferase (GlcNAc)
MPTATIFVQIPAYRDRELAPTLRDLYARATDPSRLHTCVVWQHAPEETLDDDVRALPGLELVDVPAEASEGCNWARRMAQDRWSGEELTVLLDSHHRFVDGWDVLVEQMYDTLLRTGVRRPLLTGYLPAYDPETDPLGRGSAPYKMYPLSRDDGVLTCLTSRPIPWWSQLCTPIPADFLSLHFVLADGAFNREVPFDHELYFFGDELVLGLRAFSRGYDFYHPHRIVGWHAYSRSQRVPHWADHPDWYERHRAALRWMRRLYAGELPLPGQVRDVADYERRIMSKLVVA